MKIIQTIPTPTGHILIVEGARGLLECLSLGDYGKEVNIKCDAMGLSRKPDRVSHTEMLPLSKKWVITISTQYGCSMGCAFCDVPDVGPGRNATLGDLLGQIDAAMSLHPEVAGGERLNIHYARMGEPTFNNDALESAIVLRAAYPQFHVHPVVSTMMPVGNKDLAGFIGRWLYIKNSIYQGSAGLQLSINSTNEAERCSIFGGNAMPLVDVAAMFDAFPDPVGRKYTLNFAVADFDVNAPLLRRLFPPSRFIVKLTPMHKTSAAGRHDIKTSGDYATYKPYEDLENRLKDEGFDVLVFIASDEEDASRITCGNAVLARGRHE